VLSTNNQLNTFCSCPTIGQGFCNVPC
jgi:hypothetical protein